MVKRLLAYQDVELPVEADHFIREVLELMDRQHERQVQRLEEIREMLAHQPPRD